MPASLASPNTSDEKIAIFFNLFRARESVFPRLWENEAKGTKDFDVGFIGEDHGFGRDLRVCDIAGGNRSNGVRLSQIEAEGSLALGGVLNAR